MLLLLFLQDNKPVAFTRTQSAYSNIERETLAIVCGMHCPSCAGCTVHRVRDALFIVCGMHCPSCAGCTAHRVRDALGIVCGIQKFNTYLFGKPFVVVTDHKPLLMIHNTPPKSAPPRLQRLLIKIQGYDFQLVYHRPGSQVIIADNQSRLPNPEKNAGISLDVTVDDVVTD